MAKKPNVRSLINTWYNRNFSNVQIPLLQIGTIYRAAEDQVKLGIAAGYDLTAIELSAVAAMRAIVDRVRVN
jgi:hypothetical protein